uniref:Uncharacterized protein n=1 Tax=Aegilops tauschii subsp. strangulata TaxID=200361 RepID=A0A453B2H4_AEGTS
MYKSNYIHVFYLPLFKTIGITSVSKAPMVQLACTDLTTFMYFILSLFKTIEITSVQSYFSL